jgi:hypothetical protein
MWKAIFQNKLTIYKANLPSFVQKIIKSRCYVDLSRRLRLKCHPKMAAWERLIGTPTWRLWRHVQSSICCSFIWNELFFNFYSICRNVNQYSQRQETLWETGEETSKHLAQRKRYNLKLRWILSTTWWYLTGILR